jgi:hypothetical protein
MAPGSDPGSDPPGGDYAGLQTLSRQRLRAAATAPYAFGCPGGVRLWVIRANSRAAPAGGDRFILVCSIFPGGRRGVSRHRGSSAAHIAAFGPQCRADSKSRTICQGLSGRNAGIRGPSPHMTHNDGRRAAASSQETPTLIPCRAERRRCRRDGRTGRRRHGAVRVRRGSGRSGGWRRGRGCGHADGQARPCPGR